MSLRSFFLKQDPKPLLGFRRWNIEEASCDLGACIIMEYKWRSGLNIATCKDCENLGLSVPNNRGDCDCGFNAYYDLKIARECYRYQTTVLGAIAGAGEMRIHKEGFRSEQAQIIALLITDDSVPVRDEVLDRMIETLARRKGIDYKPSSEIDSKAIENKIAEHIKKIGLVYRVPVFEDEQKFKNFVKRYAHQVTEKNLKNLMKKGRL